MSLILPISFYSSVSKPPNNTEGILYSVYTAPSISPYPDYNFIFGSITSINTIPFSGSALLNASDVPDTYWKPVMTRTSNIRSCAVSAGNGSDFKFIIGGTFRFFGDPYSSTLTILNLSATSPNIFTEPLFFASSQPNNNVETILIDDKIYIGGYFTKVGTTTRNRFAAYNKDGTLSNITVGANNAILSIKLNPLNSNEIYVAGSFTKVKTDSSRRSIAKINKVTNALTSFNASSIYSSGSIISRLEIQSDGKIIAGCIGSTSSSSKALIRLASNTVSGTTTYESFFDSVLAGTGVTSISDVTALKIDRNGKLLASLVVTTPSSVLAQNRLYRFNLTTPLTLDTTFKASDYYVRTSDSSGTDASKKFYIYDISIDSSDNIIIVGSFERVDGISRAGFAVLNNSGALLNR